MKAVILAAGDGDRLLHLTVDAPKCKVRVYGKPIIEHQLEVFGSHGIADISIVKGYLREQINYPGTKSYINADYAHNFSLASLFIAEKELDDDLIVSYGDIVFERAVVEKLVKAEGEITIAVAEDWKKAYEGRVHKTLADAEKVSFDGTRVKTLGKRIPLEVSNGEYIGLMKLTAKGCERLRKAYHEAYKKAGKGPYGGAKSFQKAGISDLLQDMIEKGARVDALTISKGWKEFHTIEDVKRAGGEIAIRRITPEARRGLLKNIVDAKGFARAIEAHNGISAIIANNAVVGKKYFDAVWISSLTESAAKGQPDIEIMGLDARLATANQILDATNKPVIFDADTGGDINAFEFFVQRAENLGISAAVVEDKAYPKRNSLDGESDHVLEDPEKFAHKIRRGKEVCLTEEFMIIARLESLIAGKGVDDALRRAEKYLAAGADAIMIHSKSKTPDEVLSFAKAYDGLFKDAKSRKPLVCVPTTYNSITEDELRRAGFNVVIHANHLLRSAVKAMQDVCLSILREGRTQETDARCATVSELFDLVGFTDVKNRERQDRRGAHWIDSSGVIARREPPLKADRR